MTIFQQVEELVEKADEVRDLVSDLERLLGEKRRDVNVLMRLIESMEEARVSTILDLQHELALSMDLARTRLHAHADYILRVHADRQARKLKLKAFADRLRYIRVGHCPDRSAAYLALERELEAAWRNA